jgi:hypothetical protein
MSRRAEIRRSSVDSSRLDVQQFFLHQLETDG